MAEDVEMVDLDGVSSMTLAKLRKAGLTPMKHSGDTH
jgi:hypothetical protein